MTWQSHSKRWPDFRNNPPQAGDKCLLGEARHGWKVRLLHSGDVIEVLTGFEQNTRVHRRGDAAVQLLPNETEVEVIDPKRNRNFQPG